MEGVKVIGSKHCTKCERELALDQFNLKGGKKDAQCRDCRAAYLRSRSFPISVKHRQCTTCGESKLARHFYRDKRCAVGLSSRCKECVREARSTPVYKAKTNRRQRQYRRRLRRDVDRTRKIMSQSNEPLMSEEARLAFVRGFFRGRSVQEQESSLITESQDLVFRIAAQVHNPEHPDQGSSYEDCVGYAYEGLLDAARKYEPNNAAGASFRTFASKRMRGAILDGFRRKGSRWCISGRRGYVGVAPYTGKDEDGVSRNLVEVLPDQAVKDVQVDGTEAKLDSEAMFSRISRELGEDHAYVIRRCYDGIPLSRVGKELGVTESRACQIRVRVREWAASIGLTEDPGPDNQGQDHDNGVND